MSIMSVIYIIQYNEVVIDKMYIQLEILVTPAIHTIAIFLAISISEGY